MKRLVKFTLSDRRGEVFLDPHHVSMVRQAVNGTSVMPWVEILLTNGVVYKVEGDALNAVLLLTKTDMAGGKR